MNALIAAYRLRGMDDGELDRLIESLELQISYRAATHLGTKLVDQLLNALTAARLERERRCAD